MTRFVVAVMDCDISVSYKVMTTQRLHTICCQSKTNACKNALGDAQEDNESVRHFVKGRFMSKGFYISTLSQLWKVEGVRKVVDGT
jgi:hypothetical protein